MDHMRITVTEPSSVMLHHNKQLKKLNGGRTTIPFSILIFWLLFVFKGLF